MVKKVVNITDIKTKVSVSRYPDIPGYVIIDLVLSFPASRKAMKMDQKLMFSFSTDIFVLKSPEPKIVVFGMLSVCISSLTLQPKYVDRL